MERVKFTCFKCKRYFLSFTTLIAHLRSSYQYLQKYECAEENCSRSFNDLYCLKKHYRYDHLLKTTNSPSEINSKNEVKSNDNQTDDSTSEYYTSEKSCNISAENPVTTEKDSPLCKDIERFNNNYDFIAKYFSRYYSNMSNQEVLYKTFLIILVCL